MEQIMERVMKRAMEMGMDKAQTFRSGDLKVIQPWAYGALCLLRRYSLWRRPHLRHRRAKFRPIEQ